MSPVTGQGAIQLQQSMLGPQEAAEVRRVQRHHHGDVVHTTQRKKGFDKDVLVRPFFQHLEEEEQDKIRVQNWPPIPRQLNYRYISTTLQDTSARPHLKPSLL